MTTLRDCGSVGGVSRNVKRFIQKGRILGPDIMICGMAVTSTGGHCNYMDGEADGVDAIRHLIRQQQKDRIDFVKLMATAGGAIGVARGNTFQPEEYQAAVDEAYRPGLKISMHVCTYDGVKAVADTGWTTWSTACSTTTTRSPAGMWIRRKSWPETRCRCATPSLPWAPRWSRRTTSPEREWTAFDHSEYKRISEGQRKLYETMRFQYECGCELVAGSDSGWRYCDFSIGLAVALKLMEQAGIPLPEILVSATRRPAKYL